MHMRAATHHPSMLRGGLAALLLALSCAVSGAAASAAGMGPLISGSAFPPLQPFLNLPPESSRAPEPGVWTWSLGILYGNVSHYDPFILYDDLYVKIDGEILKLGFGLETGLPGGFGLAASIPFTIQYGGFLDPAIQAFHNLFCLPNGGREKLTDNSWGLRVIRAETAMVDLNRPGFGLGDLVLKGKWTWYASAADGLWLALQTALKLPTGSTARFLSNGRLDAACGLLVSLQVERFALFGGLRYVWLGEPSAPKIFDFNPHNAGFFLALEWMQNPDWSWLAQVEAVTSPFRNPHPWLGVVSGALNIGFKTRLAGVGLLQFSLAEEFLSYAQLDISMNLALVRKL
jgi:hypothetical protein